jgi:hypothetical protein
MPMRLRWKVESASPSISKRMVPCESPRMAPFQRKCTGPLRCSATRSTENASGPALVSSSTTDMGMVTQPPSRTATYTRRRISRSPSRT